MLQHRLKQGSSQCLLRAGRSTSAQGAAAQCEKELPLPPSTPQADCSTAAVPWSSTPAVPEIVLFLTSSVVTERNVSGNNSEFLPDQFRQKLGVPRGRTTHQPGNLQKKRKGGQHGSASFTRCDPMTKQLRSIVPSKINHSGLHHWEQADRGYSNGFCGYILKEANKKKPILLICAKLKFKLLAGACLSPLFDVFCLQKPF